MSFTLASDGDTWNAAAAAADIQQEVWPVRSRAHRRRRPDPDRGVVRWWDAQTYGTRDLDDARAMVLEYLDTEGAAAPADTTIEWVETGT
ncbi:hypothetical protein [Prescottella agglutinans]|uniref:Uncharacterized protein n=1 Tax=Prescottella agglutinans TaxID=1644129 RepID=A0ABT6MM39_9NOCA|nr:hypothetical protein [Prescottella agglutinans]MDH6284544.1 hypothetical protein [Prescottella agglutinans]